MSAEERKAIRADKPFAFSEETERKFQQLLTRYPKDQKKSLNLPCLWLAQRQEGWVSAEAMEYIAERLEIPVTDVYEVATFYTMYHLHPIGKYHIQLCRTLSCELRGKEEILKHISKKLGIKPGQTTADGRFTLSQVECLAACGGGPMMQLNDDYHENLTPERVDQILDQLP
ncbi:NADH-quinone oxidoreductase subunit NuoE [Desulfurispira natronophila]|uniref:NADH-quinone oxidoreductase subunit E n=1 Tax=Desulfurispira natronophila TaxID=682562 RepID=A0A7W8DGV9_9BACT|nr:NADH-quinone oxidoreductase subunit NuoE [Desulfurispira natronophila]MBB5021764.1 NADH-quinone oxidoreductase subunit E [Desulfurispira natronophila]